MNPDAYYGDYSFEILNYLKDNIYPLLSRLETAINTIVSYIPYLKIILVVLIFFMLLFFSFKFIRFRGLQL